MTTPIIGLDELAQGQSQKEVTHNTALQQLEGRTIRVLSRTNGGPPASPAEGATYILDVASGAWSGLGVGNIAHYYGGAWHAWAPVDGLAITVVDEDQRIMRVDGSWIDSYGFVRLFDDFMASALSADWFGRVGSDPECVTPTPVVALRGVVQLVTGDDAAGTHAVNGSQLEGRLNWQANLGDLICEFRLKLSAITNVAVFVGLTDQNSALEMPIQSASSANTLTTNATDAVGVMFDTAMSTDNWWLVGVANNVDATAQNSALAPVAATYENWKIILSAAGVASFIRNGILIGTAMTGAVTATIPLCPVVAAFSRGAASRNIDVDFGYVQSKR